MLIAEWEGGGNRYTFLLKSFILKKMENFSSKNLFTWKDKASEDASRRHESLPPDWDWWIHTFYIYNSCFQCALYTRKLSSYPLHILG